MLTRKPKTMTVQTADQRYAAFHLSFTYLGEETTFHPRIPYEPYIDRNHVIIEDATTPRVSLAPSIEQSLKALMRPLPYWVYIIKNPVPLIDMKKWMHRCPPGYGPDFTYQPKNGRFPAHGEIGKDALPHITMGYSREEAKFHYCVPDAKETGELWALKPVRMKCLGRLTSSRVIRLIDSIPQSER